MIKPAPFLILFCLTAWSVTGWGQGCSDAGFCTMGAMKPDQPFSKRIQLRLRSMDFSYYHGKTTLTPVVSSVTADLNFSLNSRNGFQVKLPYQWVEGKLGRTEGAGDLSLCFTRLLRSGDVWNLNGSLGAKLPTNDSDKTNAEGLPLPMYYQTSLGTYDGILGLSAISRKWLFATGVQVPFNGNGNQFLWGKWNSRPELTDYVRKYDRALELERGIDVMVRGERNFRFSRFNASIGLLPIWRIRRDVFTNPTGDRITTNGTTGMALSAIATMGYNFNVRSAVRVLYGRKVTQRDLNPDGLTRQAVLTVTYSYKY